MQRTRTRTGFTIVELLVVVSIIALLIAILLPAIGKAREAALLTQSLSNLRNMGTANAGYSADWADRRASVRALSSADLSWACTDAASAPSRVVLKVSTSRSCITSTVPLADRLTTFWGTGNTGATWANVLPASIKAETTAIFLRAKNIR